MTTKPEWFEHNRIVQIIPAPPNMVVRSIGIDDGAPWKHDEPVVALALADEWSCQVWDCADPDAAGHRHPQEMSDRIVFPVWLEGGAIMDYNSRPSNSMFGVEGTEEMQRMTRRMLDELKESG